MSKITRILTVLFCILLMALVFTACDKGEKDKDTQAETGTEAQTENKTEGDAEALTQAETEVVTEYVTQGDPMANIEAALDAYIDGNTTILFKSNHDGTCRVVGVRSSAPDEKIDLVIPETSPSGDRVAEIERISKGFKSTLPHVLLAEDFEVIRNKVLEFYENDENNSDFIAFTEAFQKKYLELSFISDRLKEDLLCYPEAWVCDIYISVLEFYTPDKIQKIEDILMKAYPEYTENQRQRDLEKLLYVCQNEGVEDSYASQICLRYSLISAERLNSITIPNSVTNIGESAFEHCTGLTSITIPNSVTNIGESAFEHCTGLTSITIPNSVTNISKRAFVDCVGLTSIIIPDSVKNIGEWAFASCDNLTDVYFVGTEEEWEPSILGLGILYIPSTATIHYNYQP